MKIIIEIKDSIKEQDALEYVTEVIKQGKISQTWKHKIKHYCWVTTFNKKIVVQTRQKKNHNSADSFIVYKNK